MSAATSYSRDTTDILDEQVDSSAILINRLDAWRHAVYIVHNYAHQTLSTQNSITAGLAKQHKSVSELPSFNGSSVASSNAATPAPTSPRSASVLAGQHQSGGASAGAGGSSGGSAVASAFQALAKQTDRLWQESDQTAASIKSSIIPQLDALNSDLEKHHKTLRTQGTKLSKEVEKHRENTMRHLEHLGRTVSIAGGSQKPDPKNDPYVLHRKVRGVAAEQINKENQFSESNLNVQNNFGSLEQHIVEVLQNAIASLNELTQRFSQASAQASSTTERQFAAIQPSVEWSQFKQANAAALVPDQGFQRDPSRVTFANSDAESTVPIIEGTLNRKGTVLKGQKPGYYVLTQSGFLHQFKSADYLQDSHPELSLFIPESEISGLPAAGSGEQSFKIVSRDSNKVLSPRHKYTFSASSYDELVAWHTAIARVAGATATSSTLDNADAAEDPGVESVYEGGAAGTAPGSAAATTGGAPTTRETGPGSPTGTASTGFTDPGSGSAIGGAGSNYGSPAGAAGAAGAGGLAGGALGGLGGQQHDTASSALGREPQQFQSGLGQDAQSGLGGGQASQFGSGPQSGVSREASQLGGGPQHLQQGLGQDAQSGLGGQAAQFGSGPQSGLSHETSQLSGGPQQLQSGLGQTSQPGQSSQFGSGFGQDTQSGLGGQTSQLGSGPQSGLDREASQYGSGAQPFQSGLGQDSQSGIGGQASEYGQSSQFGSGPQSGLDRSTSQYGAGQSGSGSQFGSGPQSGLDRSTSQYGAGQSGTGQDLQGQTSQFGTSGPQSGLGGQTSQYGSGSQYQSGLGQDTSKLSSGSDASRGLGSGSQGGSGSSSGPNFAEKAAGAVGLGGLASSLSGHHDHKGNYDSQQQQGLDSSLGRDNSQLGSGSQQQYQPSSLDREGSQLGGGAQQYQSSLDREGSKLGSGQDQFRSGLKDDVRGLGSQSGSHYGKEAGGVAGLGGLGGAGAASSGLGSSQSGGYNDSGLGTSSGSSNHAYNQLAGDRYSQNQSSSAYGTPHQPSQSQFQDQRYGDDTTPFTTSERVEGLRLGDESPQRATGGSLGQGPLTTSEQVDKTPGSPSGNYGTTSGYHSAPRSPVENRATSGSGIAPRSPPTSYGSNAYDKSDTPRSPAAFVGGVAPRSPTGGESSGFQGSRSPSGTSGKSAQGGVPHYKLSPSKRGTLQSDRVDGGGTGGTFGAIPVSPADEGPAREAVKEHEEKVPEEQEVHHHHHLHVHHHNQPEIQHKGHRHNPDEGLPGAHVQEKPREGIVASSTPSTPRFESAKPTSDAQAFTHSGYGSPRLGEDKSGLGNIKARDVNYSKPDSSAYPTIAESNKNTLIGSPTHYDAPAAGGAATQSGSSSQGPDLNHIASRDVQYSHPKPGDFSTIATGSTNPLLDSSTHYNAPAAPSGTRDTQSGGSGIGAADSTRNIQYSRPDPSQVGAIGAGTTNPLLGSSTQYNAPGAPSAPSGGRATGAGYDSNLESRAAQQFTGAGSGTSTGGAGAGYSDLGSKSQKEPFTIVSTQDVPRSGSSAGPGHNRNASFEGINHDTGSRLDPLSSKYGATGGSRGTTSGSSSGAGAGTGPAAGTVAGGALGYGAGSNAADRAHEPGVQNLSSSGQGASAGYGQGAGGYSSSGHGSSGHGPSSHGTTGHTGSQPAYGSGTGSGYGSSGTQPGATRVTGAGGQSQGTQGLQDSARDKASSGGEAFGDYSHGSGSGSGGAGSGLAGGAAGAGGAGALGAAAGHHHHHHHQTSGQQQQGYGSSQQQPGYGSSQQQQSFGGNQQSGYGSTGQTQGYDGTKGASQSHGASNTGAGAGSSGTGTGSGAGSGAGAGAGAGAGTGAAAGGVGGAGAGAGAGAAGEGASQGGSQYRPYSHDQHGSQFAGNAGGYSQKDYSSLGPSSGGDAEYLQGPGSDAGGAKAKTSSGHKLAGAAGGLGALGGLAGAAGIPGGGEISQATGIAGSLGQGGVKNAVKNQIPGMGQYNQAKNVATGNFGGAAKQEVPGANQASQFSDAAKDVRGGGAANKAEGQGVKEAEKAEKPSGFKKLANVFKS